LPLPLPFDDPATFGRIAATNALNDVFAMGGTPLLALSIAAKPARQTAISHKSVKWIGECITMLVVD